VEPIEIKASPGRMLRVAGMALLMAGVSLWVRWIGAHGELHGPLLVLGRTGLAVLGWFGLAFSLAGLVASVRGAFDRRPRVTLTAEGLEVRQLGVGLIPWRDLLEVRLVRIQKQPFLELDLRDPEAYLARMSGPRRALVRVNALVGCGTFFVNPAGLTMDAEALGALLVRYRDGAGRG
jgi:hypothetical protein